MPRRKAIVTLLTDFGTADTYVGQVKGAILSRCRDCTIVDLSHAIPPGDVRAAAFALAEAAGAFPPGTVHVCVVDPAVGTAQARLAVRSGGDYFLAPDNGLVWPLVEARGVRFEARKLRVPRGAAPTFHGRDVFAPAAAHLAAGKSFAALGPRVRSLARLELPRPRRARGGLVAEVIHVDRFGNLVTSLRPGDLAGGRPVFRVGRARVVGLAETYGRVRRGELLALVGSSSFVELAVAGGSAAKRLGARRGTKVRVALDAQ